MKYSEFYQTVKDMGFKMTEGMSDIYVENSYGDTVFLVSKDHMYNLDSDFEPFVTMKDEDKEFVFELVYQLAKTPLAEREEEKRYWLQKIPVPLLDKEGEKKWLWKYTGTALSNVFGADTIKVDSKLYKTIFTESEVAEMDIVGFEKVEVEE